MPSFNNYTHVWQPIKVGNLTLKNRLQFSPMVCCCTTVDGQVSDDYVQFVGMQARTGVGLVTIGSSAIDHEVAGAFPGELDVTTDKALIDLLRVSEEVHRYGAKISLEMMHAGRSANPDVNTTGDAIAPSPIPTKNGSNRIREMTYKDIETVIRRHCDVAERLVKAEFDMVMVHAAHGNLIAQFLSPLTNHRTDAYGGSQENRLRFLLELLCALRERVGDKLAIDMRISGDEIKPGGMKIGDTIEIIKAAQPYIDSVHVSAGLLCEPDYNFYTMPPLYHPHCHNVKYSEAVKSCPDIHIPVTTVGSITTIAEAEEIIASGKADMVAMARQYMADPDTIKNAWCGHDELTRPCLRCFDCTAVHRHICCAINPVLGRENRYREIPLARRKKKTVVIGGGAAGMMAAQTLIERGHDVVLFEKSDKLGGMLPDISSLPFKQDMRSYLEWNVRTTMSCGVDVRLGTEATPELVLAEKPDALFVAVGSERISLPIPGADGANVHNVLDVDTRRAQAGARVIVCGGGLSGAECALALAQEGRDVTVVDMIPVSGFASGISKNTRGMLMSLLAENGVKLIGESKVVRFSAEGVEIEDKAWRHTLLPADTIVTAFGMKRRAAVVEQFRELIPEVYVVGDCYEVKNIKHANKTAFDYAVEC